MRPDQRVLHLQWHLPRNVGPVRGQPPAAPPSASPTSPSSPCNGTAARPQLANPWALRSVPYTGYRPAYIKHHGSHVFASAVAPYAVTPRMAPPEHRAVAAAHAAAWGPARWPRAQDWKWQWHAKTRRRIPGPAGPAPAPQPPTEALGKAIFLGMALQNVTGARRGLQVGLQNGEFAFDTLAAWPNCTRYDIVRGSWEAPPPRRAPAPAATPAVAEPQVRGPVLSGGGGGGGAQCARARPPV